MKTIEVPNKLKGIPDGREIFQVPDRVAMYVENLKRGLEAARKFSNLQRAEINRLKKEREEQNVTTTKLHSGTESRKNAES